MPELEIGLANGSEFSFDQSSCSLMQRRKYLRRILLDLN